MTADSRSITAQFRLPEQDLSSLSFCGNQKSAPRPAVVKGWADQLPAIRIAHTSVQLYKALPEVCRLRCSYEHRLEMLEALRPYVQNCIQGLAKDFLGQPLILPEGPLKTAVVAQALQKHMSVGYCMVLVELVEKGKLRRTALEQFTLACHRALTGLSLLLLRSYQLYTPIPPGLWQDIHNLYRLAEQQDCLSSTIVDQTLVQASSSSLLSVYLRALLLAASRPNQMRQQEVSATFEALEDWSRFAKLVDIGSRKRDNLFVVDLNNDVPPLGKTRYTPGEDADIHELDLSALVAALSKQADDVEQNLLRIPRTVSPAQIKHLIEAWSVNYQRAFERTKQANSIEVCVGLTATHHHIINTLPFEQFLGAASLDADEDGWASSFDTHQAKADSAYPSHNVAVVDSSAGGYCLEWRKQIPVAVKAGELIGLREKGRHRWAVGIIRWVQQRGATRLGIQLLAPKTTPYGAAIENEVGDYSDFRRVLMLPELKAANQPATLLTASVPFKEYDKLQLNNHGDFSEVQLQRRLFASGSVNQFTFREYAVQVEAEVVEEEQAPSPPPDEDFTSVWDD